MIKIIKNQIKNVNYFSKMFFYITVLLLVLFLVLFLSREYRLYRWTSKIPGFSRFSDKLHDIHFFGESYNFGNVYMAWRDFWTPVIVIKDLDIAKEYYKEHLSYIRDDDFDMGYIMNEWLGKAIATTKTKKEYNRHSKIFLPLIKDKWLSKFEDMIYIACDKWVSSHIKNNKLNINEDFNQLPLKIISVVVYGDDCDFDELRKISQLHYSLVPHLNTWYTKLPFAKYLLYFTSFGKRLRELKGRWKRFNDNQFKGPFETETLMYEIAQQHSNGKLELNEQELLCDLYEAVVFNDFGIMLGFGNVLTTLANDIEKQNYLRETIKDGENELLNFVIGLSHDQPMLSLTFPERIHRDKIIDGHYVPQGTTVMIDVRSINENNEIENNNPYPRNFHRFGLGVRSCPGRKIAHRSLMLFAKLILEKYIVESSETVKIGPIATPFTPYSNFPSINIKPLK